MAEAASLDVDTALQLNRALFNELDYQDEHGSLKRAADYRKLDALLLERHPDLASVKHESSPDLDIPVETWYTGPRLPRPLTLQSVHNMLAHFKRGEVLHMKYANQLLMDVLEIFRALPNVTEIPVQKKTTVCGDLHGQLSDLLTIFHRNGYPDDDNAYLFNGDFVDRGPNSVEVFLTLCAFKILHPNGLHLNRGNHESRTLNLQYGFEDEVLEKYDDDTYELFQEVFSALPCCSIIEKRIFVVHGGLPRLDGYTIADINKIDRFIDEPEEIDLFQDLLWSDPVEDAGRHDSSRGAGVMFGPDVTTLFLRENRLRFMIRSHEVKDDGYEVAHQKKCLTVFSASNYGGSYHNKGAFICIGPDLVPHIHTFYAVQKKKIPTPEIAGLEEPANPVGDVDKPNAIAKSLHDSNMSVLREKICEHRQKLSQFFNGIDSKHTGFITLQQWQEGMRASIPGEIPWTKLTSQLLGDLQTPPEGHVMWEKFLERYQIQTADQYSGWEDGLIKMIQQRIYQERSNIADAFKMFDKNGDGSISPEEFEQALQGFDLGLSKEQIGELMHALDTNRDGLLDFNEFVGRFKVTYTKDAPSNASQEEKEKCLSQLQAIGDAFLSRKWTLEDAFAKFDRDGNGRLSYDEFHSAIEQLEMDPKLSDDDFKRLMKFVDEDGSGFVDYKEFVSAFKVEDTKEGENSWQSRIIRHISGVLYNNRMGVKKAFRFFDRQNTGTITPEQFVSGMEALNMHLEGPLSTSAISELVKNIDINNDGIIDYQEFTEAFKIVDSMGPPSDGSQTPKEGDAKKA